MSSDELLSTISDKSIKSERNNLNNVEDLLPNPPNSFYEHDNYGLGANENELKLDISKTKLETKLADLQIKVLNHEYMDQIGAGNRDIFKNPNYKKLTESFNKTKLFSKVNIRVNNAKMELKLKKESCLFDFCDRNKVNLL